MIGAAKLLGATLRFRDDGGSMMAADIIESAQLHIFAANYDDGFADNIGGEKLSRGLNLVGAAYGLPGFAEDGGIFELRDAVVEIPGRGNGGGVIQWVIRIVEI